MMAFDEISWNFLLQYDDVPVASLAYACIACARQATHDSDEFGCLDGARDQAVCASVCRKKNNIMQYCSKKKRKWQPVKYPTHI